MRKAIALGLVVFAALLGGLAITDHSLTPDNSAILSAPLDASPTIVPALYRAPQNAHDSIDLSAPDDSREGYQRPPVKRKGRFDQILAMLSLLAGMAGLGLVGSSDVKTRPTLRVGYTTAGAAITMRHNTGGATVTYTGIGDSLITFQAGEGYGANEINVQVTSRDVTPLITSAVWLSATTLQILTVDATGAAAEGAVDVRVERVPPV